VRRGFFSVEGDQVNLEPGLFRGRGKTNKKTSHRLKTASGFEVISSANRSSYSVGNRYHLKK